MRFFTGISLASNVVGRLSALIDELRPFAAINWVPADNLHITTRFIGEWPDERLPELTGALATVPGAAPIPIAVSRFGFLPTPHHPHSFFAGVQAGPALAELAASIDRALQPLGCVPEARPYRPHVTLARIKHNQNIAGLRERIATITDFDFGSFDVRDFHLYLSRPTGRGSAYTRLATYDLMREKSTNA
jgi:2'-5' RNA ligase